MPPQMPNNLHAQQPANRQLATDVTKGLGAEPKYLPSKYFYDAAGDKLFQQIMQCPDYYLTRAETEVFLNNKKELFERFNTKNNGFDLVDLGAGDGSKTSILLQYFNEQNPNVRFFPIDISPHVLNTLAGKIKDKMPNLYVKPLAGEYFHALDRLQDHTKARKKAILFLVSNLGNFNQKEAIDFLARIHSYCNPGDHLLVGFDLKKDPQVILQAYNDHAGLTRNFNLNLLKRLNRELGANFDTTAFYHYPTYDPQTGQTKSFLVSQRNQSVYMSALQASFSFAAGEAVFTEVSQKYDVNMVEHLCHASGFRQEGLFYDCKHWYVNALWVA